jgi:hypothetical protein
MRKNVKNCNLGSWKAEILHAQFGLLVQLRTVY